MPGARNAVNTLKHCAGVCPPNKCKFTLTVNPTNNSRPRPRLTTTEAGEVVALPGVVRLASTPPQRRPTAGPRGAYGLCLQGVDGCRLLRQVPFHSPTLRIERRAPEAASAHDVLSDEWAQLRLRKGGSVSVDRNAMVAVFRLAGDSGNEELVHPYLAGTAAVVSRWLGRETFHAGAFVVGDGAWGLLGVKGAGKSSTLAWLARLGFGVMTDDLAVLENGSILAGPSCIDLRADASERFKMGEDLGVAGSRQRWRVVTGPVPAALPLRGWVLLAWGGQVELVSIPPSRRLSRLLEHLALLVPPLNPAALLDLAVLPCLELRRPRHFQSLAPAVGLLVDAIGN